MFYSLTCIAKKKQPLHATKQYIGLYFSPEITGKYMSPSLNILIFYCWGIWGHQKLFSKLFMKNISNMLLNDSYFGGSVQQDNLLPTTWTPHINGLFMSWFLHTQASIMVMSLESSSWWLIHLGGLDGVSGSWLRPGPPCPMHPSGEWKIRSKISLTDSLCITLLFKKIYI